MSAPSEPYTVTLLTYRSQYDRAWHILSMFGVIMGFVIVAKLVEPLSKTAGLVVLASAAVLFTALLVTMPLTYKWWTRRGAKRLDLGDGRIALVEPRSGSVLRQTEFRPAHIRRAEYHFQISGRFGHGTYRAPLISIPFGDGEPVRIGTQNCPVTWSGELERLDTPQFTLEANDWHRLITALGLAQHLVPVTNIRVR